MAVTGKDRNIVYALAVDYKQNQTITEFVLLIGLLALCFSAITLDKSTLMFGMGALIVPVIKVSIIMAGKEARA